MTKKEYITLKEWAEKQGFSRRKAEMLAKKDGFQSIRMKRVLKRTIWQTMVLSDYNIEE